MGTVGNMYPLSAPNSDLAYLMGRNLIRKYRHTVEDARIKTGATQPPVLTGAAVVSMMHTPRS